MIKHNTYFDGGVQSLGFTQQSDPKSVGVMMPGEYRFDTAAAEKMSVISGALTIKLEGANEWTTFADGQSFNVKENSYFDLKVEQPTAYLCEYL
ncbi:pyrimidine/purine nucleoside phosphorylase [Vibrio ulleungensis]|uniref:Pyrimidine/purine nucleoside phosphorylase n=1 Tax=Vibrio ulleungensis TaxID=2807619 RepID=A0ABS2HER6_9VIBR|nr:pyrimidine/purine nucleoside phosphorylase [Vibrio ulleungensis]MBM7035544.1 pyrimidine/purine nucleoside phosphorylase [Vibrio ulleungensis]